MSSRSGLLQGLRSFFGSCLDILVPALCRSCDKRLQDHRYVSFCDICWGRIQEIVEPICKRCGAPQELEAFRSREVSDCLECSDISEVHFENAVAAGLYEGILKDAIHIYKLEGLDSLAKPLAKLAVVAFRAFRPKFSCDFIVAVPPSPHRLRERGFDPTGKLALNISNFLSIPLITNALLRHKGTIPQSQLSRKERLINPSGRFSTSAQSVFGGSKVLLIDDIYTTGATVMECSRVLKAAGVREVCVLTVARGHRR